MKKKHALWKKNLLTIHSTIQYDQFVETMRNINYNNKFKHCQTSVGGLSGNFIIVWQFLGVL